MPRVRIDDLDTAKAEINGRLNEEVFGLSPTGAPDRLSRNRDLDDVLAALADRGWSVVTDTPSEFVMRQAFVMRVTRSPEHQARAEAKGEVAPGANTYERIVKRTRPIRLGEAIYGRDRITGEGGVLVEDRRMARAIVCLACAATPERPAGRVRDL